MSGPVARIRGRKLQRMRSEHLRANPLCVVCLSKGLTVAACELDHVLALTNGGTNDLDNMQGLCTACHADKTRQDLGHKPRPAIGLDGWHI